MTARAAIVGVLVWAPLAFGQAQVVTTNQTQTLANKTLSAPKISGLLACSGSPDSLGVDASSNVCTDASGAGDAVTVNGSATTGANLLDGDIDWTLDTGTSPDNITATVACSGCIDITDLASDSVGEPELKAVDAAVDEECLTFESTTGDFEWQTCGTGSGDAITVNAVAATDANFLDGDIDFTLNAASTPDDITATVACTGCIDATDLATDSVGAAEIAAGAVEAAEIASDAVTEAKLKAVDAAVDEECLTFETTTGDFEWQSCGTASGKPAIVWTAQQAFQPATAYATLDARNIHPILDFDASADECVYFPGYLPAGYAGGGLELKVLWMATSATTNAVVWRAAIERHDDDAVDLDADSFAADQSVTVTTATVSGEVDYATISFTSGAQMDSLAASEGFRLRLCRDADNASDTMAGDAEMLRSVLVEP